MKARVFEVTPLSCESSFTRKYYFFNGTIFCEITVLYNSLKLTSLQIAPSEVNFVSITLR